MEYRVLDFNGRCPHLYRNPTENGYDAVTVIRETETAAPIARPDAVVTPRSLLPPAAEQSAP